MAHRSQQGAWILCDFAIHHVLLIFERKGNACARMMQSNIDTGAKKSVKNTGRLTPNMRYFL